MKTQPISDWLNKFTPYGPLACAINPHMDTLRRALFAENEHGADIGGWLNGPLRKALNARLAKGDHEIIIDTMRAISERHHTLHISWNHTVVPPDGSPSYVEPGEAQLTLYALSNKARRTLEEENRGDEAGEPARSRKRKPTKTTSY